MSAVLTPAEIAASSAAALRVASAADLTGGALPPSAVRTISGLSPASEDAAFEPRPFAAALISAWRSLSLYGEASTLRQLLRAELTSRLADASGGRVRAIELAGMCAALAIASTRVSYSAEQDASAARSELAELATPSIEAAGSLGTAAHEWLSGLTGAAALELSTIAANRAPLVRVETGFSVNAHRAAYDLYGDANRAGEIVTRNAIATAAFLPTSFEALST